MALGLPQVTLNWYNDSSILQQFNLPGWMNITASNPIASIVVTPTTTGFTFGTPVIQGSSYQQLITVGSGVAPGQFIFQVQITLTDGQSWPITLIMNITAAGT